MIFVHNQKSNGGAMGAHGVNGGGHSPPPLLRHCTWVGGGVFRRLAVHGSVPDAVPSWYVQTRLRAHAVWVDVESEVPSGSLALRPGVLYVVHLGLQDGKVARFVGFRGIHYRLEFVGWYFVGKHVWSVFFTKK